VEASKDAPSFAAELSQSYGGDIISRRIQATIIDFVFLYLLMMVCVGLTRTLSDDIKVTVCLFVVSSYYLFLEGLTGVTVGKMMAGIRVVGEEGDKPSFSQGIVRTTLRVLEVNPLLFGGVPAGIVVARSRKKQRLGDMLACTYVVYKNDLLPSG